MLLGGNWGTLLMIDLSQHKLAHSWSIGEPISALDCLEYRENLLIMAATESKKIYSSHNFLEKKDRQ